MMLGTLSTPELEAVRRGEPLRISVAGCQQELVAISVRDYERMRRIVEEMERRQTWLQQQPDEQEFDLARARSASLAIAKMLAEEP